MLESFDNQKFEDIVHKYRKERNILDKIENILKGKNDLESFTFDKIGLQNSYGKCCDDPEKLFDKLASAKIAAQVVINNRKNNEYFKKCVLLKTHSSGPCHEDVTRKVDNDNYVILDYIILHKLLYDIEANALSQSGQTKKKRNKDTPIKCNYCDTINSGNNEECEICQAELDPYEVQLTDADGDRRVNKPIKSEVYEHKREMKVNEPIKSEDYEHKGEIKEYEPIKSEDSKDKMEVTSNGLIKNGGMTSQSSSSRRDSGNMKEVAPPSRMTDLGERWTCKQCTLSNKSSNEICDACFFSKNEVVRPLQDDHMKDGNEFPPLTSKSNKGTKKERRQPLENNQFEEPYKSLPQESHNKIEGGSKGRSEEGGGAIGGGRSRSGASGTDKGRSDMSGRNGRGGIDGRKIDKKIEGNKYGMLSVVSDDTIMERAEGRDLGGSKGDWNCPRCTFLNKAGLSKCAVCGSVDNLEAHTNKRKTTSNSNNDSQTRGNRGRGRGGNKDNRGDFQSLAVCHTSGQLKVNATFYDDSGLDNASVESSIVCTNNKSDSSKNKNIKSGGSQSPGGGYKSEGKSQFYDRMEINNDCGSSKTDRSDINDKCESRGNKDTKTRKENKETNQKGRSDQGNLVDGQKGRGGGISQSPSMDRGGEEGSPPCLPRDGVPVGADGWTCPSCTFNNKKGCLCCEVCYTFRIREDVVISDDFEEVVEADDIPQASWGCIHCKKDNPFDTYICHSCRKYAPFFQKWVCERCAFFNDKLARECAVCDNKSVHVKLCDKCKKGVVNLLDKVRQCADCVERERETITFLPKRLEDGKGNIVVKYAASDDGFIDYNPRLCPRCKNVLEVPTEGMCRKCMGNTYYCNNRHCGAINNGRSKYCRKCKLKKGDNITDYNVVDVHNGSVFIKMWQCTFCGLFNAKGKCTKCKNLRHSAAYKKCPCNWVNLSFAVKCDKCFKILH